MSTQKQIDANRRNARHSTGPRTSEGRTISRLNAYQHGLTGHIDVMTEEQRTARDAFHASIVASLNPAGAFEEQLAHSIADAHWRLNRVAVIENNIFAAEADHQERSETAVELPDIDRALASARAFTEHPERFQLLTVYEMRLHRKAQGDLKQLRDMQEARRAAGEKETAAAEARRRKAFHESATLLELNDAEGEPRNPEGTFEHPNGFVFSYAELTNAVEWVRRLQIAQERFDKEPRVRARQRYLASCRSETNPAAVVPVATAPVFTTPVVTALDDIAAPGLIPC